MKRYIIEYTDKAEDELVELFLNIWEITGPQKIADDYERGIRKERESLDILPYRYISRDDLASGIKMTHYKEKIRIAYYVNEEAGSIQILKIELARKNLTAGSFEEIFSPDLS